MAGQFPTTPHSQSLSGNFLSQASCNLSYSSLPTSSVTPTVSSSYSSTWPSLTLTQKDVIGEKSNNNESCLSDTSSLEPEALMKLLNDSDEAPSEFFNHPPNAATTPTYSNQMTGSSKAGTNCTNSSVSSMKTSASTNCSNSLSNDKNSEFSNQLKLNITPAESDLSSYNSAKTSLSMAAAKTDSTTSTNTTKMVSSSEVKMSPACSIDSNSKPVGDKLTNSYQTAAEDTNSCNNSPPSKANIVVKPRDPNVNVTSPPRRIVVTLKDPSSNPVVLKPISDSETALNSSASTENTGASNCVKPFANSVKSDSNRACTPKSTPISKPVISPNPDNVESLLESMFQMSADPKPTESVQTPVNPTQKSRVLRAESVEKILKSPSPTSFNGECNLDAIIKSPTIGAVDIKEEPAVAIKEEPVDDEKFMENLEDKENANSQRVNGKTGTVDKPIKIFSEIESELEKMFAGIVEPETSKVKTELPVKSEKSSNQIKNNRRSSENSILSSCSSSDIKKSAKSLKRIRDDRKDRKHSSKKFKVDKDASNDSFYSKLRGPVIHVEGPKDNPTSYTIINCRTKPEDEETQDSKTSLLKKKSTQRTHISKTAEGSLETIRSTDEMWICLFCKKGPHVPGFGGDPSGDLFGPYYVKEKGSTSSSPSDQKVKKKKKLTDAKKAALLSEGILSVPNSNEYEIWVHENCCVWASGVYLVGAKLQGLEDAVWAACDTKCDHCGISGASIGCAARHCRSRVHYSCALHIGWHLDQETFTTKCNQHENSFLLSPSAASS